MSKKDITTIRFVICIIVLVIVILSIYSSFSSKAKINELIETVQSLQIAVETDNTPLRDVVGGVVSDEPMRSITSIQNKLDELEDKIDKIGSFESVKTALDELIRVVISLQSKIEDMYAKVMSMEKVAPASSPSPPQSQSAEVNTPISEVSVPTQSNKTISVKVTAPQVEDMYGYEFKIYFNSENVEYTGNLKSSISTIGTIFDKDFDSYILVGATMIGDVKGYSGDKSEICTLSFAGSQEIDVSEFRIEAVSIVKSDLEYVKNITDWSLSATVGD